jgi:tRNA threonylcarbamoyladenosine biosynthesis protein TsaB
MITLALDASTYTGTVAVIDGTRLVAERSVAMRGQHEERLMPAVAECLAAAGWPAVRPAQIVCGEGPGSFTSLRIAGAIAKGLVLALGVPLLAAPSLGLIVAGTSRLAPGRYVAALDAMRGDAYVATVDVGADGGVSGIGAVGLVPAAELPRIAAGATLIGPGREVDALPHARGVASLLGRDLLQSVDVDHWEPRYGRLAEAQVKWEAAHGRSLTGQGS